MRKISLILSAILIASSCSHVKDATAMDELPPIWPDYTDVTIPVNIAPLNFGPAEWRDCSKIDVTVSDESGRRLLHSAGAHADFPLRRWHRILDANAGKDLIFSVALKSESGWKTYKQFCMHVSVDEIDYGLTYRLIPPGYQSFGHMGLYERELSTFRQRTLIDTRMVESGCINCHTENRGDPGTFCFHIRGRHSATFLHRNHEDFCLNTKTDSTKGFFVYPYWHPSGRYVAYSTNATRQSFYSSADKMLEVYDEHSDVLVYDVEKNVVIRPEAAFGSEMFETKPSFSADGRTFYYCVSRPGVLPRDAKEMRYNICSLPFDPETGTFGSVADTVLAVSVYDKSFISARPSYDGKYLMVAACDYGTFPLCHEESDIWVMNLATGEVYDGGGINSDRAESMHNWSTNSKWAVVSSRREDGLYTRLYLAHMGADGVFEKSFLLPQKNPWTYYHRLINSYNVPDFTTGRLEFDAREARKAIVGGERVQVLAR